MTSNLKSTPYSDRLRARMQQVGLSSYGALGKAAGVSKWQIEQLRLGKATEMRLGVLHQIAAALQISLNALIQEFSELPKRPDSLNSGQHSAPDSTQPTSGNSPHLLPTPDSPDRDQLQQEFRQATLQAIESWMLQFPTAAYAAQQNSQMPAAKLLPLLRPIEQLLQSWGVESIAPVGAEVPFNPQKHQLMEGTAQVGDRVRVRYAGYLQGEKLLFRAKVSPC
ncbi:helix-turn-helix domain-containing protein [Leptolyngbya ohadii]|uniref:helix-turn-helix domain-containing protein n=1 Tax=Leptolyngbya ohadii TaxID=1962290 RepID=UPI000B59D26A|nr:helix-turn-helix domain-containing protein [Leptolyngbya ohadii]